MTTLNTIIEEEKTTAEQLDEIALSRVTSVNGVLVQMWDRNVLSAYIDGVLSTAMQRAYEAGRAEERLRAFEILSTYALKTETTNALDLIEQAQQEILSTSTTN